MEKLLLKEQPLRYAGQSVAEEFERILDEKVIPEIMTGFVLVLLVGYEWVREIFNTKPHPVVLSIITAIFLVIIANRVWKNKKYLIQLEIGRNGERVVGQHLEELRVFGAIIFHDIVGNVAGKKFNVDHVVVAPQGVFTIETKTWHKSSLNMPINFDGENIIVNGYPGRRPVDQIFAQASYMRKLLREEIGKEITVWPVIVFPERFIEPEATNRAKGKGFWLLNPKVLPSFIKNERKILSEEEIKSIAYHLSRCAQ